MVWESCLYEILSTRWTCTHTEQLEYVDGLGCPTEVLSIQGHLYSCSTGTTWIKVNVDELGCLRKWYIYRHCLLRGHMDMEGILTTG